eukprot:CAMPEP_0180302466 /NCGR_PEP_ID=MMETSP0988-20121125/24291_1 /TAXON_ID=697907 /ORGANISM="non described non described, Strain CCMP2293" /LENGTH=117 /DNA_ID=CAMNT_0022283601 /DNA_START=201 /DNA_END=557 /DNA_ORIENTATION=+
MRGGAAPHELGTPANPTPYTHRAPSFHCTKVGSSEGPSTDRSLNLRLESIEEEEASKLLERDRRVTGSVVHASTNRSPNLRLASHNEEAEDEAEEEEEVSELLKRDRRDRVSGPRVD